MTDHPDERMLQAELGDLKKLVKQRLLSNAGVARQHSRIYS